MSLSDEILNQRRGSITASAAHRIMAGWDTPPPTDYDTGVYEWLSKNQPEKRPLVSEIEESMGVKITGKLNKAWDAYKFDKPPQGLITYAEELACEELFDPDPNAWNGEGSDAIKNGNEWELAAMEWLAEVTGVDFVKTGDDQIHLSDDGIGVTPDGIAYDELDLITTGGEAKCRSAIHHARQLAIKDNATLIELDFDRYCQVQVGMLVAEVDHWYSVNYNPLGKYKSVQFGYCIIRRDDAFLEIFKQRAAVVFEIKEAFINRLVKPEELKEAA